MTTTTTPHWTDSREETTEFAAILMAAGVLTDVDNTLYYFEKPWKYDPEHEAWVAADRPSEEQSEAWGEFLDALADI